MRIPKSCREGCRRARHLLRHAPVTVPHPVSALASAVPAPGAQPSEVWSVIDHPPLSFASIVVVNDLNWGEGRQWVGVRDRGRGWRTEMKKTTTKNGTGVVGEERLAVRQSLAWTAGNLGLREISLVT